MPNHYIGKKSSCIRASEEELREKVEVDLTPKMPNIKVFSGSSHPDLARRLVGKDNCILEILFLVGLTTIPRGASLFLISV